MMRKVFVLVAAVAASLSCLSSSSQAAAVTIDSGFDLLGTESASFYGNDFVGSPLRYFDFGPPTGIHKVSKADTIIERTVGGTLTNDGDTLVTGLRVRALSLMSANPIDIGFGSHVYYATTDGLGTGSMTITYNGVDGGTWIDNFTFSISLHRDSPTGVVDLTESNSWTGAGTWLATAPPVPATPDWNGTRIPGVTDTSFFVVGPPYDHCVGGVHVAPNHAHTVFTSLVCPEPSSITLVLCAASVGLIGSAVRYRRNAK